MPGRRGPGVRAILRRWPWALKLYRLSKRGFPFTIPVFPRTPMGRIRGAARAALFAEQPGWLRWTLRLAMTLAWPAGALVETLRTLPTTPAADRPAGVSATLRRGGHMLFLALRHNIPPGVYVAYRLHDPARRDWAGDCLLDAENNILPLLNRRRGADNDDIQDKGRFAELCRRHDLPCIPTLAVYRSGRQVVPDAPFLPDQTHLWVKDLAGHNGSGAAQWRLRDGGYHDADGRAMTPEALVQSWRARDCIVQPLVTNHPVLAALSDGSLVDFRIVTGIDPAGVVEIIATLAILPWCDTAHPRRYILGAVSAESGHILNPRVSGFQPIERHPATGAAITEIAIPHWDSCLELVRRAHGLAFPRFVFLGWDVAVTAAGPLLIETNSGWGAYGHQLVDGLPMGRTAFATIATGYLEAPPCA